MKRKKLVSVQERQKIDGQVLKRESLDERTLLRKVSGGRALQGVLLTKRLEDLLEDRSNLLEIPENVSLSEVSQDDSKTMHYSSAHQEDQYKKAVHVLGHDTSMATNIPTYEGVTDGVGTSESDRKEDENAHKENIGEAFSSTVKFSTMHVASYLLKDSDLKLSDDAKSNLRDVLQLISIKGKGSIAVQEACEKIFNTYGSHIYKGPLKFGGNFCWTCSSRGFSDKDTETVKKMQSIAVSGNVALAFAGFGGSVASTMDAVKASYQGMFSKELLASSQLDVKITGGPPEATDYSLWKSGLVAYNSTWILTDRGKQLVSIWEIIKRNHERELGGVRDILRQAWEKMTGLKAEPDLTLGLSYTPERVLEEISEWDVALLKPQQVQDNLDHLLRVRRDILNKYANPSIWVNKYLSQSMVQSFLKSVVHSELKSPHLAHIKLLMRQLVGEQELSLLNTRSFPGIDDVTKWLDLPRPQHEIPKAQSQRGIVYLDSFVRLLKKTHDDSTTTPPHHEVSFAVEVAKGINDLRSHYRKTYEDILITILIHPFESSYFDDVITLKPISLDDILTLCKVFTEQGEKFNEYALRENLCLQAYLFKLAVSRCDISQLQQFLQRIKNMMEAVQLPLEQGVLEEVDAYLSGSDAYLGGSSITSFTSNLQVLMTTGNQIHQTQPLTVAVTEATSHSLKSVLMTAKYQHESSPDHHSSVLDDTNPNVCNLFERLGLSELYTTKLKLADALCIQQEPLQLSLKINGTVPVDPKQLPKLVLHKLMCYDYLCRSDLIHKPELWDDYEDYADDNDYADDDDDDSKTGIHPVDCIYALILCSDDFLRQDLLSRLAMCQLAVPLILPDPFTKELILPLWALRSIVKDWSSTYDSKIVQHSQPIVQYGMPIVSFISFGKPGVSKSKILNEVISESHYDHFFHHNLPGGEYKCLLGDGLVDMCWYLPAGKPTDTFQDAVTFLNLHGDAKQHPQQSKFLSKVSSMCFALLTEEDIAFDSQTIETLKAFSSSPGGITVLNGVDKKPEALKKIPKVGLIQLSSKTDSQVKNIIRTRIKTKLANVKKFPPLEECCKIKEKGISVDEESDLFEKGQTLAYGVMSTIKAKSPSVKEMIVPSQSTRLWQTWAAEDKELYRQAHRGNATAEQYTAKIESEKAAIRRKQLKHLNVLTPTLKIFIESLLKLEGSSNSVVRNYFLQYLKLELNNLSRRNILGMRQKYVDAKRKFTLAKIQARECDDKTMSAEVQKNNKEIQVLQDDILNASFGLEHLFRELGQVYEAAVKSREYGDNLSRLPKVFAELLIEGYPLEVMDGDAAHVPLEWVTAVLNEAVKMLNDPKVFVLSVLGLQGTGKATMLNTVFGLQFNVSAGRCTRGAYMQLLQLGEEFREKTGCSYGLVIDTEGLRAPELDSKKTQKHDNELATFVIGLANMTLINIYGQAPGDMDDILQISVHAFLRMNLVNYNLSCQFVHHNTATDLGRQIGHEKFTQKLNQFTLDAAKAENRTGQYESFMKFDDQRDIYHFPGLWMGDPPMAPVNQGYSQKAQELKHHFIERACEGNLFADLSSQCGKIDDLWKALLKENFVFSFKNTLEITAYHSLETEYSKWDWEFQEGMLNQEHKAGNLIITADVEDVPDLVKKKQKELIEYASEDLYKPLKMKMDAFFKGEHIEILAQWQKQFETRFDQLSKDLQDRALKHCQKLDRSREAISTIERVQKEYSEKIVDGIQKYISSIKQEGDFKFKLWRGKEQAKLDQNLEKRNLESSQLEEILKKNLFTSENLMRYREENIITEDEERSINAVIQKCGGQLKEKDLSDILVGGKLTIVQVKMILRRGRQTDQTEEELKAKFNEIWIELIGQIHFHDHNTEGTAVEEEVESKLTEFVTQKGHYGLLIDELKQKSLSSWGHPLELIPFEEEHYTISRWGKFKKGIDYVKGKGDGEGFRGYMSNTVLEMTGNIMSKVSSYAEEKESKNTDFNITFVTELLHTLNEEFESKDDITFTPLYIVQVYLTACGYMIPVFKKMRDSFNQRNDPRRYLERHLKEPLFTSFKNQYYQTAAEEAIASTLCASLTEPIKMQARQVLGSIMVGQMKGADHYFSSKSALKVKVLLDLHEEDNFESYMFYLNNAKRYLQNKLDQYTLKYCDEITGENTRLQVMAKEEVTRLVGIIESKINYTENESSIHEWVSAFCKDEKLRSELGVRLEPSYLLAGYDSLHELNIERLKGQIRTGLKNLMDKLHDSFNGIECDSEMWFWRSLPHELLGNLIGCTEQCPFCGEQCDLQDPDHTANNGPKHFVSVHRSTGLRGNTRCYEDSEELQLMTGFCPTFVSGRDKRNVFRNRSTNEEWHPYEDYQSIYPQWSIPPDVTASNSLYWKQFIGKYKDELATWFKAKPPKVPEGWLTIEWEEVASNLKKLYK